MSKPPKGAFGAVVQGLADRQAYAEQLKANARAGRPLVAPPPAPKAAATAPPPLFSTPAKAFGLGDGDSDVMDLPPPPDDPSDRLAHLRWLMDVQRVGIAAAKPGTAAHTGAIKLYGELQAQYAAAALAAAAPPEIDAAEAEAQLRELALGLPAAVLEVFAVAYLDAHPALCHPEYVDRVRAAAAGLRAMVQTRNDVADDASAADRAHDRAPWDDEEEEA